jgi:hypothetical protein
MFQKLADYSNTAHQRGVIGLTLRRAAELLGIVGDDLKQLVPAPARHFRRLIPPPNLRTGPRKPAVHEH